MKRLSTHSRLGRFGHSVKENGRNLLLAAVVTAGLGSSSILASAATTTTFTSAPAPRVTFTFDDGAASAIELAAPTLAKYGYAGVNYVITGCIGMTTVPNTCGADGETKYMTWDQVRTLQNQYGWEIGSHTVTHPLLVSTDPDSQPTALTQSQRIAELTNSKTTLEAQGLKVESFADPYGDWNMTSLAEIAKIYSSHRPFADIITATKTNTFPYNDYLPYVMQVQLGNDEGTAGATVAQVKAAIDTAKAGNKWIVLVFHDITAGAATKEYEYANSNLDQIAAYVQQQNIEVTTMTGGLAGGTNLLSGGDFEAGLGAWTTDNAAAVQADNGNNGSYPTPTGSVKLTGQATAAHLFSPTVAVDPAKTYFFKGYLSMKSIATGGNVTYYVEELDAAGNFLSGQTKSTEADLWTENIAFEYKPATAAVAKIRLQVIVTGAGVTAYVDNLRFYAEGGAAMKAGDVNGDNLVNIQDATLVSNNWGKTGMTRAQGDLNGDGTVNIQDATLISTNWGK